MKRAAFYTLGCKVNQYDTEAMLELFRNKGYDVVDFDQTAEVYVINTCTVTNLGDRKSRQMVRRAHRLNPAAIIVVAGCYAQRAADEVLQIPGVRLAIGTKNRKQIVELVEKAWEEGVSINAVEDIMQTRDFEDLAIEAPEGRTRAFLKIQEGCNQFCSYCIIPYARGPIRSRDKEEILHEVERLAESGFKEVVLTGIHLASYGKDLGNIGLLDIIRDVHRVEGIQRIRLGSVEPTLLTPDFTHEISHLEKVCHHYHVSLQSGSSTILKRMNRKYSSGEYRGFIHMLRRSIPDVAITTDVMVGFPGETEGEFLESYAFVQEMAFSKIHVFQYSPREGTVAAKFSGQVSSQMKDIRSKKLIHLGETMEREYASHFLGTVQEVLFEEQVPGRPGWIQGFTSHYLNVMVQGELEQAGSILPVAIEGLEQEGLTGKII